MEQNAQRGAIALLLCAPSTLHKHWVAGDTVEIDRELARLTLSPAAITAAKEIMAAFKNDAVKFGKVRAVMPLLMDDVWGGGEPHPNDPGALALADAARKLDGE